MVTPSQFGQELVIVPVRSDVHVLIGKFIKNM